MDQPADPAGSDQPGTCQSCARDDDDLVAVRRVYVVPESWDTAGSTTVTEEVELWCFACRSMYPHVVEGDDGEGPARD